MKTIIISTIVTISLTSVSCVLPPPDEDTVIELEMEERMDSIAYGEVKILLFDECQYIIYKQRDGTNKAYGYMSHKGNCNNPEHYYQFYPAPDMVPDTLLIAKQH
jgi:hypothetical protein